MIVKNPVLMVGSIVLLVKGIRVVNMTNTDAFTELATCMKEIALAVGATSPVLEHRLLKIIDRLETVEYEIIVRDRCC